jgi:hypothetical protein
VLLDVGFGLIIGLMKLLGVINICFNVDGQMACICQILEKNWDYSETIYPAVHRLLSS